MQKYKELKILAVISGIFAVFYFLPVSSPLVIESIKEGLNLTAWYAKEHVILCLIPAFFIAGAISIFVSQDSVIKYFGASAKKWISYSIASISGTVLAVCSCTILPLFAGIYKRGAGIGPATAFLYSGPAVNVLAIILTARIIGVELGIARIIGAVSFSVVIGLIMHFLFSKEDKKTDTAEITDNNLIAQSSKDHKLVKDIILFVSLTGILIFANWGSPQSSGGFFKNVYDVKWYITGFFGVIFAVSLVKFLGADKIFVIISSAVIFALSLLIPQYHQLIFLIAVILLSITLYISKNESRDWLDSSWDYMKLITPLLAAGVLISGFLLGSPEKPNGLIPNEWIVMLVGGNSIFANFFASIVGAFMYFATLTEIPILQRLLASGMGKGPALALLLSGPALSLPSMLIIKSVLGLKKTIAYVILVVVFSTISGLIFGEFF